MVDLSPYNTLRLPARAGNLVEINSLSDISGLPTENVLFLGSGANILFKSEYPGTVALVKLIGRQIKKDSDNQIVVELGAGENWHDFVTWAVGNNLSGVENMALIPGKVGAAAAGNIAAYGQNQEDVFVSLEATDLKTQKAEHFTRDAMKFGYRESTFKNELKNYLITSVTYKLSKTPHFDISYHSRYESLQTELSAFAKPPYTPRDIAQAVINLRTVKQPDIKKIGTAGSFFKNPTITLKHLKELKKRLTELQFYPLEKLSYQIQNWEIPEGLPEETLFKIPAGRLLDELNWRNKRVGNVGTFEKHALVIVTYPGATGPEVYEFAESMRADVKKNFGVSLEYEVVII